MSLYMLPISNEDSMEKIVRIMELFRQQMADECKPFHDALAKIVPEYAVVDNGRIVSFKWPDHYWTIRRQLQEYIDLRFNEMMGGNP